MSDAIRDLIRRQGPISFSDYMNLALYDPEAGFYATGGQAGRSRDFITSPEVGPLFGAVIANALDDWWEQLDKPDPFFVVEAGAGRGALARAVLDASPACLRALRYIMVEQSELLRAMQSQLLAIEPPAFVLGPHVANTDGDDEGAQPQHGVGPLFTSIAELPAGPLTGVVFANELLDNLSIDIVERRHDGWYEVRVGGDGPFVEFVVPASEAVREVAEAMASDVGVGQRIPIQRAAQDWLRAALSVLDQGRVVVVDYADNTASIAARGQQSWLRTYRAHGAGGDPLDDPGRSDVTCDVDIDQLACVREPTAQRSQAEFLRAHGIDDLVLTARRSWGERAHVGDLDALKHRSRINEASALLDEAGLGGFRVLEWVVD